MMIIIYFLSVNFFSAKLGLDVCPISPSTDLWTLSIQAPDQVASLYMATLYRK